MGIAEIKEAVVSIKDWIMASENRLILKDWVTIFGIFSASIVGALGLSAWRKQLQGKTKHETIKQVLKSVYKIGNGFDYVRNPLITVGEYPPEAQENVDVDNYIISEYVYKKRLDILRTAFEELEEAVLEGQFVWGRGFSKKMSPLRECYWELLKEIRYMIRVQKEGERVSRFYLDKVNREEHGEILYAGRGEEGNTFTHKINEIIDNIENDLKGNGLYKFFRRVKKWGNEGWGWIIFKLENKKT